MSKHGHNFGASQKRYVWLQDSDSEEYGYKSRMYILASFL